MKSFLRVALPFMAAVAGANIIGSSTARSSFARNQTTKKSSSAISNFLDIQDTTAGKYVDKFTSGISQYAKAGFQRGLEQGFGGSSMSPTARIGGSKVAEGTPLSFKAGAVDLRLPGSANDRVLQKTNAAMRSDLFNQIVTASLKASPRLGRTINLAQKNINVKSRTNPQVLKA